MEPVLQYWMSTFDTVTDEENSLKLEPGVMFGGGLSLIFGDGLDEEIMLKMVGPFMNDDRITFEDLICFICIFTLGTVEEKMRLLMFIYCREGRRSEVVAFLEYFGVNDGLALSLPEVVEYEDFEAWVNKFKNKQLPLSGWVFDARSCVVLDKMIVHVERLCDREETVVF